MARYLISFDDGSMDPNSEHDLPSVSDAAHNLVRQAKAADIWWLGAGTAEARFHDNSLGMYEALDSNGNICHVCSSVGTGHEWQTWRRSLHNVIPRLFSE